MKLLMQNISNFNRHVDKLALLFNNVQHLANQLCNFFFSQIKLFFTFFLPIAHQSYFEVIFVY